MRGWTCPPQNCGATGDAERPGLHSHAERGNDLGGGRSAMIVPAKSMGMIRLRGDDDRSHAQQRNASGDAPRSAFGGNAGVTGCNLVLCAGAIKPCGDGRAPPPDYGATGTQSVPGCIPTRSMGTIWGGGGRSAMIVPAKSMGMIRLRGDDDRSHALRGNASGDAPRSAFGGNAGVTGCNLVLCAGAIKPCGDGRAPPKTAARRGTQSVPGCIPTQSVGMIWGGRSAKGRVSD